jgi:hypothetical protein
VIRSRAARAGAHIAALAAYGVVALIFAWPLPLHMDTHLTGSPSGDTGAYIWNLWVFRRELADGGSPLQTERVFSLAAPTDLSLHNYTVFANLSGLFLQKHLGLIASFNVIYLGLGALSAYALFLLARHVVGGMAEAWLAGALFGFSPFLSARGTVHFSLVAALPLPLFMLALLKVGRTGRPRDAAVAGAVLALAALCDPYYFVFCMLILCYWVAVRAWELRFERRPQTGRGWWLARGLEALILAAAALMVWILATGGDRFRFGLFTVSVKGLHNPVLFLVCALLARAASTWRAVVHPRPGLALAPALRLITVGALSAAMLVAPLLVALARRALDGSFVVPPLRWRSSPAGVDLLAYLMPNPNHALFGDPFRLWLARIRPDGFGENAASLTLTAMAVVGAAMLRRMRLPAAWVGLACAFALLSLGPFVWVGGFNTRVPTPWAVLRYLPGVGLVHWPTRFAIVVMLAVAILFAFALRSLTAGAPPRRRALVLGGVGLALLLELAPCPRPLHAATVPSIYRTIAADPCDVRVLELPVGLRDGIRSVGAFRADSQFFQTVHGKPLVGGYLSRISDRCIRTYRRLPVMGALLTLSQGGDLADDQALRARAARRAFLARSRVGFVVVDKSRASRKLRRFAIDVLQLQRIQHDGPFELYLPFDGSPEDAHAHRMPECIFAAPPKPETRSVAAGLPAPGEEKPGAFPPGTPHLR